MSDNSDWKGRRIGPYEVGERYLDVPEDEGQLYEAHHVETGEPALVVMPGTGEAWRTRTPWSAQTTSFTEPECLVLHPERAAQTKTPSIHELTLGHMRVAGALASLDGQPDAQAHFTREFRPPARRQGMRWGAACAGVAVVAGLALMLWPRAPVQTSREVSERIQAALKEPTHFADRQDSPPIIGYAMPEKPFKEQATPPCIPVAEVEIRGGCWVPHKLDAPCPSGSAEYQGHCYYPVKKKDPQPRSVEP
ncbi:hypothetical protein [Melittangium boletus]|uniref:Protein kinase n=1 Tax=Melittangium boletus DSM 14713 TaxID=1294270 RepID=A0A250ID64_9BACT|nr:hypothetical protein [Melittangium boletus]ATB29112.1 hypothetical protein MEBOL_002561 [Melittangium boletus DSM 14713]